MMETVNMFNFQQYLSTTKLTHLNARKKLYFLRIWEIVIPFFSNIEYWQVLQLVLVVANVTHTTFNLQFFGGSLWLVSYQSSKAHQPRAQIILVVLHICTVNIEQLVRVTSSAIIHNIILYKNTTLIQNRTSESQTNLTFKTRSQKSSDRTGFIENFIFVFAVLKDINLSGGGCNLKSRIVWISKTCVFVGSGMCQ